jgi:hypothetical protein
VLIVLAAATGVTGDDANDLPDAVESITPVRDAVQVPAQTQVIVDLAEGYEGRLTIDDVTFPTMRMEDLTQNPDAGAQVEIPAGVVFEPGNDTLTFTPGPGIEIESFDQGIHRVSLVYWDRENGEDNARTFSWIFNVV